MAFWTGHRRVFAWSLTLALVVLTVAQAAVPVALNLWSQRLFDALEQRDFTNVLNEAGVAVLIILANMLVMTAHLRAKRRLQVEWRGDLTRRILDQWMIRGRDYRVQRQGGLDNPDGRIAEDVRVATETTVELGHSLLYCVLLLLSFAQILWGLSGTLALKFGGWELALPGYLVWIAVGYAGVGAAVAAWLGQPLTRAANLRHAKEADFRFGLASVRESGSTIPLQSIDSARPKVERQFDGLIESWARQTRALAHLITFSSSWHGTLPGRSDPGRRAALHRRHDHAGRADADRPGLPADDPGPGMADREHAATGRGPRLVHARDATARVAGRVAARRGGSADRGSRPDRDHRADRDRRHGSRSSNGSRPRSP